MDRVTDQSFLTPEQAASVAQYRVMDAEFRETITVDTGADLRDSLTGLLVSSSAALVKRSIKPTPSSFGRSVRDLDDLSAILRESAYDKVRQALGFNLLKRLVAVTTGINEAEGNEASTARGYALGYGLIDEQATREVDVLLLSSVALMSAVETIEEDRSPYSRAFDVFARLPRVKPPPLIVREEKVALSALQQRVIVQSEADDSSLLKGPRMGRSRIANAFRLARSTRHLTKDFNSGLPMIENLQLVVDTALSQASQPIEFGEGELTFAARSVSKARRYVEAAARLDGSIYEDPRVQFAVYLGQSLIEYDVARERGSFNTVVKKVERRQKRARVGGRFELP